MSIKKQDNTIFIPAGTTITGSIIAQYNPMQEDELLSVVSDNILALPLKDTVAFPEFPLPIKLDSETLLKTSQHAFEKALPVWVGTLKEPKNDITKTSDFYKAGVIGNVVKIISLPDNSKVAFLNLHHTATLNKISKRKPFIYAKTTLHKLEGWEAMDQKMLDPYLKTIQEEFNKISRFIPEEEKEALVFSNEDNPALLVHKIYMIAMLPLFSVQEKISILESENVADLLENTVKALDMTDQRLTLQASIHMRTHENLSNQQKEIFLKQQLRTIQEELGEANFNEDIEVLRRDAENKKWTNEAKNHFEKELRKLEKLNPGSPDYAVLHSYLETFIELPWNNFSQSDFTLEKVEKILNEDHYGLKNVKDRIIEQMAVLKLRDDLKAPILCLYGPPGVGKTSLGKSVAKSLGREYCRISLGGIHDEAEIRGHRRTYIGAMPGRIISSLTKCGTGNPVIVLDEVDKIRKDFKGDPSTALLEVLDPEQNNTFHDNYVDYDYDLSKILFIATANDISQISRPLLDRMEIIEISGYVPEEKLEIARRHLIPKVLALNGFEKNELKFDKSSILYLINNYTRESGVRQLEKKLSSLIRKIARLKASEKPYPKTITKNKVRELLGKEIAGQTTYEGNEFAGVATGLAWTASGGEILYIESSLSPGKGEKLTLTGNLGDVMKESATIALEFIKAHADSLNINKNIFEAVNIHIHVPEGAVPKDGPSAGITIATSLISAFTGKKIKEKLAMTGELTLRGKVLPVGGIKEKILAAKRSGITDIILSHKNKPDIEEIEDLYKSGLRFHYVNSMDEVLALAITNEDAKYKFKFTGVLNKNKN